MCMQNPAVLLCCHCTFSLQGKVSASSSSSCILPAKQPDIAQLVRALHRCYLRCWQVPRLGLQRAVHRGFAPTTCAMGISVLSFIPELFPHPHKRTQYDCSKHAPKLGSFRTFCITRYKHLAIRFMYLDIGLSSANMAVTAIIANLQMSAAEPVHNYDVTSCGCGVGVASCLAQGS